MDKTLHFDGLKDICQTELHSCNASRSFKARSCLYVSVKLVRGMRGIMREQKVVRVRANAQNEKIIHGVELVMSKWNEPKFCKK